MQIHNFNLTSVCITRKIKTCTTTNGIRYILNQPIKSTPILPRCAVAIRCTHPSHSNRKWYIHHGDKLTRILYKNNPGPLEEHCNYRNGVQPTRNITKPTTKWALNIKLFINSLMLGARLIRHCDAVLCALAKVRLFICIAFYC